MGLVPKEILRVGKYWTNNGLLDITQSRLARYEKEGNAMLADRLHIPLPLNHQPETYPVTADVLANRVKNNTGFAARYYMMGDSLWCDLDVADEEIVPKLNTTIKFVSPQISKKFVDGRGREWNDVITHIALTPRPRFIDQKPFGTPPAASAASPQGGGVVSLSEEAEPEEIQLSLDDLLSEEESDYPWIHGKDADTVRGIFAKHAKEHGLPEDADISDGIADEELKEGQSYFHPEDADRPKIAVIDYAPQGLPPGLPRAKYHKDMLDHHYGKYEEARDKARENKESGDDKGKEWLHNGVYGKIAKQHLQASIYHSDIRQEAMKDHHGITDEHMNTAIRRSHALPSNMASDSELDLMSLDELLSDDEGDLTRANTKQLRDLHIEQNFHAKMRVYHRNRRDQHYGDDNDDLAGYHANAEKFHGARYEQKHHQMQAAYHKARISEGEPEEKHKEMHEHHSEQAAHFDRIAKRYLSMEPRISKNLSDDESDATDAGAESQLSDEHYDPYTMSFRVPHPHPDYEHDPDAEGDDEPLTYNKTYKPRHSDEHITAIIEGGKRDNESMRTLHSRHELAASLHAKALAKLRKKVPYKDTADARRYHEAMFRHHTSVANSLAKVHPEMMADKKFFAEQNEGLSTDHIPSGDDLSYEDHARALAQHEYYAVHHLKKVNKYREMGGGTDHTELRHHRNLSDFHDHMAAHHTNMMQILNLKLMAKHADAKGEFHDAEKFAKGASEGKHYTELNKRLARHSMQVRNLSDDDIGDSEVLRHTEEAAANILHMKHHKDLARKAYRKGHYDKQAYHEQMWRHHQRRTEYHDAMADALNHKYAADDLDKSGKFHEAETYGKAASEARDMAENAKAEANIRQENAHDAYKKIPPDQMSCDFLCGFVDVHGNLPDRLGVDEDIYAAPPGTAPKPKLDVGIKMMKGLPTESWQHQPSEADHESIKRQAILGPRLHRFTSENGKVGYRTAALHKDDQPLFRSVGAIPPLLSHNKTVFVHPHADVLHPEDLHSFHEAMANQHAVLKNGYAVKKNAAGQDGVYPHIDPDHDLAEKWHRHMAGIHQHNANLMNYFQGSKGESGWKYLKKHRYSDNMPHANHEVVHQFLESKAA